MIVNTDVLVSFERVVDSDYRKMATWINMQHVTPPEQHAILHFHVKAFYTPNLLVLNELLCGLHDYFTH